MFNILKGKFYYFLYLLIIAALAIRIFFVFELPYGQNVRIKLEGLNDEPSHFNYIKYLAKYRSFPIQKMSVQTDNAFIKNEFEYYQPPLYYLICSPFAVFFKSETALLLCRIISLLFGLLTVYLIYKLVMLLGLTHLLGLFAGILTMYLLSPSYFSSLCSNDSLSWLFPVVLLIQCYQFEKKEPGLKELLLISCTIALALLTKSSNLILIIFTLGVSLYDFFQGKKRNAFILTSATIIGTLMASPWYIRNLHVYNSFLAMEVGLGPIHTKSIPIWQHLFLMFRGAIGYFWFPMQHVPQSIARRCLTLIGLLIFITQAINYLIWSIKYHKIHNLFKVHLLLILTILAYVNLQLKWDNPEGRYLFTSLFPIAFIFIAPLQQFLNSRKTFWHTFFFLFISFFPYFYFLLI